MHYRSIWISDVHLGRPTCQAGRLNEFLAHNSSEFLYLVGDIIDGWKLRSDWYWPQSHADVVRRILSSSEQGTAVYYIAGNHDEFLRRYLDHPLRFGNIAIATEAIHHTVDGRRMLVLHGDEYDMITRHFRRLAIAGDSAYQFLMRANRWVNFVRERYGMPYWSLSAYAKHQVKRAVNFVSEFEHAVARDCKRRGLDGVICGHIHHAEVRTLYGIAYHNCGDWVESCTALGESQDGRIALIRWDEETDAMAVSSTVTPLSSRRQARRAAGHDTGQTEPTFRA